MRTSFFHLPRGLTIIQATANAKDTIAYGTNIVGGVSPGKGGQIHLDRPVFNTVREVIGFGLHSGSQDSQVSSNWRE